MESLTKPEVSRETISDLVHAAFGSRARVTSCDPAQEGWFNAGFRLALAGEGPARAFLKVSPPTGCPVLTYEQGLMEAEVAALEGLAEAHLEHVPGILAKDFSRRSIDCDCLFMSWLEGVPLDAVRDKLATEDRQTIRRQIGNVIGAAHRIEADLFGYSGRPALQASSWRGALASMVTAALDDALRYQAALPEPPDSLRAKFEAALSEAGDVPRACLTHFDLWDKNVLVRPGPDGWRLSGVVDWERGFFGEGLADVFSATVACDGVERQAVLEGIAEAGGARWSLDEAELRRLALYRAYLWLVAIAEAPSRGFGGSIRTPQSAAARRLVADLARAGGG